MGASVCGIVLYGTIWYLTLPVLSWTSLIDSRLVPPPPLPRSWGTSTVAWLDAALSLSLPSPSLPLPSLPFLFISFFPFFPALWVMGLIPSSSFSFFSESDDIAQPVSHHKTCMAKVPHRARRAGEKNKIRFCMLVPVVLVGQLIILVEHGSIHPSLLPSPPPIKLQQNWVWYVNKQKKQNKRTGKQAEEINQSFQSS